MKLLVLLGLVACAASQTDFIEEAFKSIDLNRDHIIEQSEIQVYYDTYDTNGNGKVNFSEFSHNSGETDTNTPKMHGTFNYYDKLDGSTDNHISSNVVSVAFHLLDTNGDSQVTLQEFTASFPKILAGIQAEINNLQTPVGK